MGKLIDVEKFKKDLIENYAFIGFPELLNDFCAALDSQPPVDAVPVVHGRWIRVYSRPGVFKYLGWTCEQCGQRTGNEYAPQWYKFCPNCGARMDGDGNG